MNKLPKICFILFLKYIIIKNINVPKSVNCPVLPIVKNILVVIVTTNINKMSFKYLFCTLKKENKETIIPKDKNVVYSICEVKKGIGI